MDIFVNLAHLLLWESIHGTYSKSDIKRLWKVSRKINTIGNKQIFKDEIREHIDLVIYKVHMRNFGIAHI